MDKNIPRKNSRILEALAERMAQGVYLPGARLPAERDLAAEFDLDRSAVRAALVELARTGQIVREPGCRPRVGPASGVRPAPRTRPRPASRTIAVILPQHAADHGSREIMRGIAHVLHSQEAPYRPLMFDLNLRTAPRGVLEHQACAAVLEEDIAGAVVWPTLEPGSLEGWRGVQSAGRPVVFVDRCDDDFLCDFVGVDNYDAAKDATRFLLALGHTQIVHLTRDLPASSVAQRIDGYRDALTEAGLPFSSERVWSLPTEAFPQGVEALADRLLAQVPLLTAVFAVNDQVAHTLIAALEARGKAVPGDISVLGFDDDDQYSARPALLTTVRQPFERIGQRAAALLLRRLGPNPPPAYQHVLLPTVLVERSTCRSLEKSP